MDMVKMGSFLAELRKENHLTQAELGEKLGVTKCWKSLATCTT